MPGLRILQVNTMLPQARRNADSNVRTTISGTEPDVLHLHAIPNSATDPMKQASAFRRERTSTPVNAKTDSTGGARLTAAPTRNLFR